MKIEEIDFKFLFKKCQKRIISEILHLYYHVRSITDSKDPIETMMQLLSINVTSL